MASNFARIAFEDKAWTLSSSFMTLQFVYEFLQANGPIASQILSHFVSGHLLDYVFKHQGDNGIFLSRAYLQRVLRAFVSAVRRSDAAVTYLFELDNIFAVCAMFIIWKDIPGLHLLAQCCPDHPVWTECLQKLDTIPEHFELWLSMYNREEILSTISDFRMLFEGGEPLILNSRPTQRRFLMKTVLALFYPPKSSSSRPKSFCPVERNIDVVSGLAWERFPGPYPCATGLPGSGLEGYDHPVIKYSTLQT
ncbi:hypothetical protein ARMGADRAFT_1147470 [Armillaria gallica]|uniref:Uncharacterized protein n=1 Tax=Armillaria gallica TaxID=47427 RepID=A0A2H3CNI1_ARMGA|nr:hypothetical protein ARMGADRAFT_1147470 [Armillaria gallica]